MGIHLAWLEYRRDIEAWEPVAAGWSNSFFVAEGGRLMSCGVEEEGWRGVLGHGEIEGGGRMVPTLTPQPSMAGIHISSVFSWVDVQFG